MVVLRVYLTVNGRIIYKSNHVATLLLGGRVHEHDQADPRLGRQDLHCSGMLKIELDS